MEFLAATQALDMLLPLVPTSGVLVAFNEIRKEVPFAKEDRIFARDVEKIRAMIVKRNLLIQVESKIGTLEI